ncbi:unnamed protein product [Gulo gulo]|uniref:Uncharacterized protein n=1 Tax=Gulo gulo TaxID=48420 RepID=A0A9X9PZ28_GULGU|nr:unnamed protein product [Gulo gulo]
MTSLLWSPVGSAVSAESEGVPRRKPQAGNYPRQPRTCPDSWEEPACGCNVMQMAGISPCGS